MTLDIPPTRKRGRPRKNVDTELSPVHALGRGLSLIEFLGARGPQPLADIALVAYTRRAHLGGFELRDYPSVGRWVKRVEDLLGLEPVAPANG